MTPETFDTINQNINDQLNLVWVDVVGEVRLLTLFICIWYPLDCGCGLVACCTYSVAAYRSAGPGELPAWYPPAAAAAVPRPPPPP